MLDPQTEPKHKHYWERGGYPMELHLYPAGYRYIYGLVDPRTNQCHYVGQTYAPYTRLSNHCVQGKNKVMRQWTQELKDQGLRPVFTVLETMPDRGKDAAREREYWWIAEMQRRGEPLTNKIRKGRVAFNLSNAETMQDSELSEACLYYWRRTYQSPRGNWTYCTERTALLKECNRRDKRDIYQRAEEAAKAT
jgi:hypothetical protein